MRFLALDWGSVRIGAAVSDPDGKMAFPLNHFIDSKNSIAAIKKLVAELEVGQVLVGLPKNLSGEDTTTTASVKKFIQELAAQIKLPIDTFDERFSSVAAGRNLAAAGIKEKNQRGMKDNMAAQMMLESYLETSAKGGAASKD